MLIQGVYNLDSLLAFSLDEDSQSIDVSWNDIDTGIVHKIVDNENKGDFIMTIGKEHTYK